MAALAESPDDDFAIPVKHLKSIVGSQGTLEFGADSIEYATEAPGESRTWRYSDIDSISSSGQFQLTITTIEKGFNFELKEALSESRYNQIWLDIQKKNGRIQ